MDFSATRVIQTEVSPEKEGMRLDLFLSVRFTYRSRSAWQECIRNGEILLNRQKTKASRILRAGDIISLEIQNAEEPPVDRSYTVLLENQDFLAVNKNGSIPVHPSGCYYHNTLLNVLQEKYGQLYVVNRLDRETSGVILFAKHARGASLLAKLFASRQMQKTYYAIVHGIFPENMTAQGYLSQDLHSPVRKKRRFTRELPTDTNDAESCCTRFKRIGGNNQFSILECLPETGRLHQIRATLQSLGYPLAGDKLYGLDDHFYLRHIEGKLTEQDLKKLMLPRQALHAASLTFDSPFNQEKIFCYAPLSPELQALQYEISGI